MTLAEFESALETLSSSPVKEEPASGRRPMGYLCTYVPEEVLYAAGFVPIRLLGRSSEICQADQYLQTYCCSQIRSFMEDWLKGTYPHLEGVIFAHTCDTLQAFFNIFRLNNPDRFVQTVNFPSRLDTEAAYRFALAELNRFLGCLEHRFHIQVSEQSLREAVSVYDTTRALLSSLYALHAQVPHQIPNRILLKAVLASMLTDKQRFNPVLEAYLQDARAEAGEGSSGRGAKRVILLGSVLTSLELHDWLDEYGVTVVDDDLCTGRRYFAGQVGEPTLEGILRRTLSKAHCPAKHRGVEGRLNALTSLARGSQAQGALFVHLKFCDPHAFDYPDARTALEAVGVKTQLLELEAGAQTHAQLRTRVQAFAELL